MFFWNCALDAAKCHFHIKKPFDRIVERANAEEWSALVDDFRTGVFGGQSFELAISGV